MNYCAYCYEDWELTIYEEDGMIIKVHREFVPGGRSSEILEQCFGEIVEYLSGVRKSFTVRFKLVGTEFQCAVWESVCLIPYGETRSYRVIAESVMRPRAYRAVGSACGVCPLLFLVPCHRVVSSTGLGGFGGRIEDKVQLLKLEYDIISAVK